MSEVGPNSNRTDGSRRERRKKKRMPLDFDQLREMGYRVERVRPGSEVEQIPLEDATPEMLEIILKDVRKRQPGTTTTP